MDEPTTNRMVSHAHTSATHLTNRTGSAIKARRVALGWTQCQLREELELAGLRVSRSLVATHEAGGSALSLEQLEAYAAAFGCAPAELVR